MMMMQHRSERIQNLKITKLRYYQQHVVNVVKRSSGRVVRSPCGSGKSLVGIALAGHSSTLYISNNLFLGHQYAQSTQNEGISPQSIKFYSAKDFGPEHVDLKRKIVIVSYAGLCCEPKIKKDYDESADDQVSLLGDRKTSKKLQFVQNHVWDLIICDEAWTCTLSRVSVLQTLKSHKFVFMSGDFEKARPDFIYIRVWMLLLSGHPHDVDAQKEDGDKVGLDYAAKKKTLPLPTPSNRLTPVKTNSLKTGESNKVKPEKKKSKKKSKKKGNEDEEEEEKVESLDAGIKGKMDKKSKEEAEKNVSMDWESQIVEAARDQLIAQAKLYQRDTKVTEYKEMTPEKIAQYYWDRYLVDILYDDLVAWPPRVHSTDKLKEVYDAKCKRYGGQADKAARSDEEDTQRPVTAVVPIGLYMPCIKGWYHDADDAKEAPPAGVKKVGAGVKKAGAGDKEAAEPVRQSAARDSVNPLRLSLVWALTRHQCGRVIDWNREYRADRLDTSKVKECGRRATALFCLSVPSHKIWTAAFAAIGLSAAAQPDAVLRMLEELNDVNGSVIYPGKPSPLAVMSMSRGVGLDTTGVRIGITVSSNSMNYIHMETQQSGRNQRANSGKVQDAEGSVYLSFRSHVYKSETPVEEKKGVVPEQWMNMAPGQRFLRVMDQIPGLTCETVADGETIPRTLNVAALFKDGQICSLLSSRLTMNKRMFRSIFELIMCRVDYAHQHATDHMRHTSVDVWLDTLSPGGAGRPVDLQPLPINKDKQEVDRRKRRWTAYSNECKTIEEHIKKLEAAALDVIPEFGELLPATWEWDTTVPLAEWEQPRTCQDTIDGPLRYDTTDQWWIPMYHLACGDGQSADDFEPQLHAGVLATRVDKIVNKTLDDQKADETVTPDTKAVVLAKFQLGCWWHYTFKDLPLGGGGQSWSSLKDQ
jgi:hypothetical protein